ncbi:hypothetical protein LTR85_001069 [Meristemomyces frigidus]|nr:hypothetical protein LTR85_001069 [Meristemomyces frigidus]
MSKLAELQAELAECEDNVNTCNTMLQMEPDDVDAKETKAMMEEQIADLRVQIAAEKSKQSAAAPPPPPSDSTSVPPAQKYDMSKHPKFRKQSPDAPPPPPGEESHQPQAIFNVKDVVMAKYTEDKQWYQATVTSRTGSSSDPVYTVTFKGYGNTETKRKHEIRPVHAENNKKRKADGTPAVTAAPLTPASPMPPNASSGAGHVISAAPSVDTTLVQHTVKREPSKVSDGPTRMAPEPKKLKGNKALEKGKASWNSWQQSGPKKASLTAPKQKESMFRTGENPNARVGFVGQGKSVQKDQKAAKWNYASGGGATAEDDD